MIIRIAGSEAGTTEWQKDSQQGCCNQCRDAPTCSVIRATSGLPFFVSVLYANLSENHAYKAGKPHIRYTAASLWQAVEPLSLIHISEPTRRTPISYAVFCLKKKKKQ